MPGRVGLSRMGLRATSLSAAPSRDGPRHAVRHTLAKRQRQKWKAARFPFRKSLKLCLIRHRWWKGLRTW